MAVFGTFFSRSAQEAMSCLRDIFLVKATSLALKLMLSAQQGPESVTLHLSTAAMSSFERLVLTLQTTGEVDAEFLSKEFMMMHLLLSSSLLEGRVVDFCDELEMLSADDVSAERKVEL